MSSFTLTLSGNSSVLEADYFPPIQLEHDKQYECGLIDLQTYNMIPNIDETNNLFIYGVVVHPGKQANFFKIGDYYYEWRHIVIPTGSYEMEDLNQYLRNRMGKDVKFNLKVDKNTLKCILDCGLPVDFSHPNTIGPLLGFGKRQLKSNSAAESDRTVNINKVNAIRVECNIITGSYFNNKSVHTLHEFSPTVATGYKIIEAPRNVIYLPIVIKSIREICLKFVDQNDCLVDFRNENIVVRLHIRKVRN